MRTLLSSGNLYTNNGAYYGGAVANYSEYGQASFSGDTFLANLGCTDATGCPTTGCNASTCTSYATGYGACNFRQIYGPGPWRSPDARSKATSPARTRMEATARGVRCISTEEVAAHYELQLHRERRWRRVRRMSPKGTAARSTGTAAATACGSITIRSPATSRAAIITAKAAPSTLTSHLPAATTRSPRTSPSVREARRTPMANPRAARSIRTTA